MVAGRKQIEPQGIANTGDSEAGLAPEPPIKQVLRQIHQSRIFWCLVGAAGVIVGLMVWSRLPLAGQRAAPNDERLLIEPAVVSLDNMRAKQTNATNFRVKNRTDKTITLRWAFTPLELYKVKLPVQIGPGETKVIDVQVTLPHGGTFDHYVLIDTSDEIKPGFLVRLAGQVLP